MAAIKTRNLATEIVRDGIMMGGELYDRISFTPLVEEAAILEVDPYQEPNLTPLFAKLPYSTAGGYWNTIQYVESDRAAKITNAYAADGWVELVYDPAGASSSVICQASPSVCDWVEPGQDYTLMLEFETIEGDPSGLSFTYTSTSVDQIRPAPGTGSTITVRDGVQYIPSRGYSATGRLLRFNVYKGSVASLMRLKLRASIYKGTFRGAYRPYQEA